MADYDSEHVVLGVINAEMTVLEEKEGRLFRTLA
jgi:hypothetical protein